MAKAKDKTEGGNCEGKQGKKNGSLMIRIRLIEKSLIMTQPLKLGPEQALFHQ